MNPTEHNKALIRRHVERLNARDLEGAFVSFAPSFVNHAARLGAPLGVEGAQLFFAMLFTAFPDLHGTLEEILAEGDKVIDRMTWAGTHHGPFMNVPPTGKRVQWHVINIHRLVAGQIIEHWAEADTLGLLQQLGLVPPPSSH